MKAIDFTNPIEFEVKISKIKEDFNKLIWIEGSADLKGIGLTDVIFACPKEMAIMFRRLEVKLGDLLHIIKYTSARSRNETGNLYFVERINKFTTNADRNKVCSILNQLILYFEKNFNSIPTLVSGDYEMMTDQEKSIVDNITKLYF
jgi:hypothetical protein